MNVNLPQHPAPAVESDVLGPFRTGYLPGYGSYGATSAGDRIRMVKKFGPEECQQALQLPDLQATVRQAVERRQRKLGKAAV